MASPQRPCPRCQAPLEISQPVPASLQCAKCGATIKLKAASSEAIQAPPKPSAVALPRDDKPEPVSVARSRKPWLVLVGAGLAASLCLCSGGVFLVLGVLGGSTKSADKKAGDTAVAVDQPIKVKEPPKEGALDFGPSVLASYDPRTLDALDPKKIPVLEQYPWQPKELVAVLGQHRLFGPIAAISPDASLIAVRDTGVPHKATVLIGDSTTLHVQTVLTIPAMTAMAFSPDNKTLATIGSVDKVVRLWDVQTRTEIGKLGPHADMPRHITYIDNQRILVSADKTLYVWDVMKRKVIHELTGHEGAITSMAVSRDGKKAVSAGNDVEWAVRLWDLDKGKQVGVLRPERYSRQTDAEIATTVALSEDGLQVAIAGFFKDANLLIKTFDTAQFVAGKETNSISCPRQPACFAFSPDGKRLLTESAYSPLHLYDLSTGKLVGTAGAGGKQAKLGKGKGGKYGAGYYGAAAVAFKNDPGARKVMSAGYEVHVYDEETGDEAMPVTGHSNPVIRVELSPDGRHVGSTGSSAACYWRLDTALERHRVPYGYGTSILAVGFSPECAKMFYGASPPIFLDMEDGKKTKPTLPPEAKRGPVYSAAITPDGRFGAASFWYGAIPLWDLQTAQEVRQFQARDRKPGLDRALIEISPDGRRMLTYYIDRKIPVTTLWDIDYTNELHTWNSRAFFLPTGRILVLEGTSATEYAVDDETPRETGKLPLNTVGLQDFAISKDGKRLAGIVTKEGGVRVLSVDFGATVWHWRPPHFSARVVHLSPDGRYLFAGNSNGTIYVYRLPL